MEARVSVSRAGSNRSRVAAAALGLASAWVFVCGAASAADPTKSQCIDANEAAQPLRQSGKLHAAEERLLVCVHPTCPGPVRDDCAQRLTELRAATPTLVFAVSDDAEDDLSAVRVTMDGQPFAATLDGTALPVDPGEHHFVFEAEGRMRQEKTLVLREGDKGRRERVVLMALAPAPEVPVSAPDVSTSAAPHAEQPSSPRNTRRAVGMALAGVGLAGAVVSTIFGIVAKSLYDHAANDECGPSAGFASRTACTQNGYNDGQTAHSQALGSTIGFIASAALVAGGATLYFTAPSVSVALTPTAAAGGAGLGLSGRW
jgi:hypothetical protein